MQLDVGIRCVKQGNTSLQFEAGIFRGMELLNTVELVYVFADAQTQTPRPVPQAMRDLLTAYEAGQEVVTLRSGSWNDLGRDAERLRLAVFVREQGVPREIEIDEFDPVARHVVLFNGLNQPVATGRLVSDAPGVARIGRMAVDRSVRGGRWGRMVLESLIDAARERGDKEIVLHVEGDHVYGALKFESGGHRVQRVPATETQGRIHTSACTVAVMPEPDEHQAITLNPADLRIDTFRASGAGGQHINKTDSAVRVVHLPTGIVAECQDGRSQHSNKAKALQVLQARIQEKERSERAAKEAALRKGLIGSGDRSDRIRTYNFPQGRLTDHRINLTLYKLLAVMEGDLGDVLQALQHAREAEQLEELEKGAGV